MKVSGRALRRRSSCDRALKSGMNIEQGRAFLQVVAGRLVKQYPESTRHIRWRRIRSGGLYVAPHVRLRSITIRAWLELDRGHGPPVAESRQVAVDGTNSGGGPGNIYAAEALFRAGIDPRREASRIHPAVLAPLHAQIVQVLQIAVQSARIEYVSPGRFSEADAFVLACTNVKANGAGNAAAKSAAFSRADA